MNNCYKLIFLFFFFFHISLNAQQKITTQELKTKYQRANELMNNFQFGKAIPLFYECQRADQQNLDYNSKLAYCYFQQGNYGEAKIFYKEMLKVDSLNAIALSYLGNIFDKEQNYPQSAKYYEQLLTIDSTNSYYYKQNAFLALKTDNAFKAIRFFNQAHVLNPSDIGVLAQLGELYLKLDQMEYASDFIKKGLQLNANNFALLYVNARIKNKQKDNKGVIENIEKAMALGDTIIYYQKLLGAAYIKEGEFEKGKYHFERIVAKGKDGESTHYYLALAYDGLNDKKKAIEHYQKAIELGISENTALYYRNLGADFEDIHDLRSAIKSYKSALIYTNASSVYYDLGRICDVYYKDKKIALKYYNKFLKKAAKNDTERIQLVKARIASLKEYIHLSAKK